MKTALHALTICLLLSLTSQADDAFRWIPDEAKKGTGGRHKKIDKIPRVAYTKIPKKTANRKLFRKKYIIDLKKFKISNKGKNPEATSNGINEALQNAKQAGKNLIVFPKGIYMISQHAPVIFDHKNTIVDLNGATLTIDPKANEKHSIALITHGAENFRLTNGTIKGNLFTRDKSKKPHQHASLMRFISGRDIEVDHMNFTECVGFAVTSQKGMARLIESGYRPVSDKNLESGGFNDKGEKVANTKHLRTIEPYDLAEDTARRRPIKGEFEFGYIFGYGGFLQIKDRTYFAAFYDENMQFIQKKEYVQFKKNKLPTNARFIHLEFTQTSAKNTGEGCVGSITNLQAPIDVHFHHNRIYNTGSLGFAFCGGQRWIMENNHFEKCGGTLPPHYGIDFEDGWELMQDVVFRKNTFKDNVGGDLIVCAGSELLFEENTFVKSVGFWDRPHNYIFRNNEVTGGHVIFRSQTGVANIHGNTYRNMTLWIKGKNPQVKRLRLKNEKFFNSVIHKAHIVDSQIRSDKKPFIFQSTFVGCDIQVKNAESHDNMFVKCKIKNSRWNSNLRQLFQQCTIEDFNTSTHPSSTLIKFLDCDLKNIFVDVRYNSDKKMDLFFEGNKILMKDSYLVNLKGNRVGVLRFKNNKISNRKRKELVVGLDRFRPQTIELPKR